MLVITRIMDNMGNTYPYINYTTPHWDNTVSSFKRHYGQAQIILSVWDSIQNVSYNSVDLNSLQKISGDNLNNVMGLYYIEKYSTCIVYAIGKALWKSLDFIDYREILKPKFSFFEKYSDLNKQMRKFTSHQKLVPKIPFNDKKGMFGVYENKVTKATVLYEFELYDMYPLDERFNILWYHPDKKGTKFEFITILDYCLTYLQQINEYEASEFWIHLDTCHRIYSLEITEDFKKFLTKVKIMMN